VKLKLEKQKQNFCVFPIKSQLPLLGLAVQQYNPGYQMKECTK
jgi:hypothetical protein